MINGIPCNRYKGQKANSNNIVTINSCVRIQIQNSRHDLLTLKEHDVKFQKSENSVSQKSIFI